jgi:hypothetical protein
MQSYGSSCRHPTGMLSKRANPFLSELEGRIAFPHRYAHHLGEIGQVVEGSNTESHCSSRA